MLPRRGLIAGFYRIGAEWSRCINVRFDGKSTVSVDPVLFVECY